MMSLIEIKNLTQNYEQRFDALRDIDLKIEKGEFLAVIGQNGAGKTTLVKHLNGLLRPSAGRIMIHGADTANDPIAVLSQKVGYVFQNPDHQIFMDRVDKEIAFGPNNLGLPKAEVERRVREALEQVGLLPLHDCAPLSLSKGQRQRVALASVLAMKPEILALDEPTTGQDHREATQIMDLVASLNQKGHTIIFITHDMQLVAAYAKRVVLMGKGRILADGPPKKVLADPALLAETYLKPPQITLLAQSLAEYHLPGDAVTVAELLKAFQLRITPVERAV